MRCSKCGEEKKKSEMYEERSGHRKGIRSWCKDCVRKWAEKQLERDTTDPKDKPSH